MFTNVKNDLWLLNMSKFHLGIPKYKKNVDYFTNFIAPNNKSVICISRPILKLVGLKRLICTLITNVID